MINKLIIALVLGVIMNTPASAQLPREWAKDFVITIHYKSSMSGSYTDAKFTYDSIVYKSSSREERGQPRTYLMTEADRVKILKEMHTLKADQIEETGTPKPVRDGWHQSICLGNFCVEGGTNTEMDEDNKNRFLDAYKYLYEFAMAKTRSKKSK